VYVLQRRGKTKVAHYQAILNFDIIFLAWREHYPEEIVGFELHKLRKQELLGLAALIVSRN
jgi:hypothetical protein